MEFTVTTEQFEGPLDLMLHLIRQHKLDLENLDMAVLADQYIGYIGRMKEMHLEVASEYLTELAGLVEYKSRLLLPRQPEEPEDTYEENQRDQLVARLLEYQAFKEAGTLLKDRFDGRSRQLERQSASLVEEWKKPSAGKLEDLPPCDLAKALQRVLRRHAILQPYATKIEARELSTEERRKQLEDKFLLHDTLNFYQLCADCTSRHMVIVTFLALLDMMHDNIVNVDLQNDILLFTKGEVYGKSAASR